MRQTTCIITEDRAETREHIIENNPHDMKVSEKHYLVTENRHEIILKRPHRKLIEGTEADVVINHTDKEELTKIPLSTDRQKRLAMMQHQ